MKSERHFWVTLNYVHHNPVHHGYVKRWLDWPWSSARQYLAETGLGKRSKSGCSIRFWTTGRSGIYSWLNKLKFEL
jgi:putative transposase